jgi:hypothetical protein
VFLASILSLTCGNGPVRRVGFWLREPDRANAEQARLQSRPSFSLSCQLVSTLLWCGGCPWLSGPDLLIQGRTHISEPTTGDLNPFRTVRGQAGCSNMGQSRVQRRQFQAPQRPWIRLSGRLGFFKEPISFAIVIWMGGTIQSLSIAVMPLPPSHKSNCCRARRVSPLPAQRAAVDGRSAPHRDRRRPGAT